MTTKKKKETIEISKDLLYGIANVLNRTSVNVDFEGLQKLEKDLDDILERVEEVLND